MVLWRGMYAEPYLVRNRALRFVQGTYISGSLKEPYTKVRVRKPIIIARILRAEPLCKGS